ncbi:DgyrCDS3923 [Dimorphilus gyrociliatus]|uniref:DgyrCDS3923 n=1 Tax=Dimorphilus gyrociliatus TaxID=2664684 RepID=A0A7I8VHI6_9ANNE|nr:DgyrCDS3923 [Dimorphilus gyrociliatus]
MARIMHGRRKGSGKMGEINVDDLPEKLRSNDKSLTINGQQSMDPRNVCILTKDDMDRIYRQLNKKKEEEEKRRLAFQERERLREKSRKQVAQWDNTVLGLRQKKLETRRLREEKMEEERKAIDIEEEKFQCQRRKEIIEKAKTQQYYQTDRVKNFHSALLLSEVLKERDAQLELKKLKEKAAEGADNEWLDYERKQLEDAILKEQREARERIEKNHENAKYVLRQINHHKSRSDKFLEDDKIEGEELRRLAAHYNLEKKRLEEIRQDESKQLMIDNKRQIADTKRMNEIKAAQEEDEDEECRIFAAAKRKMMKMRADKEKEIFNDKQDKLNRIREKLYAQMQEQVRDEDERLHKAEAEAEEKRAREERLKEERIRKAHQEARDHMVATMKKNENLKKLDKIEELKRLQAQKEADAVFERAENEKRQRRFDGVKERKNYNLKQFDDRKQLGINSRRKQLELEKKNEELLNLEEDQFNEYAKKVIEHCEKNGRNTYPLKKAANQGIGGGLGPVLPGKGTKQNYLTSDQACLQMPSYQGESTEDTKQTITNNEGTNKRLGFVW